jgi:hypothetical protein
MQELLVPGTGLLSCMCPVYLHPGTVLHEMISVGLEP